MTAEAAPQSPRTRRLWDRAAERLGRSSRVFLIGLLCACLIEVAVDWNTTLVEINQLRGALRQRGENYVDILRKASEAALLGYDWEELDRLSGGLFEDRDVVYVRFVDVLGNTLYDRVRPEYSRPFAQAHKEPFRAHYRRVMNRDLHGIMSDPQGLRRRMYGSRHRDLIQAFTDVQEGLMQRLPGVAAPTGPGPAEGPPRVLYQDRLADARGRLDREVSYALGAILNDQGTPYGAVLIAFSNHTLNGQITRKLLKGLAVTVFFVGLILLQNLQARRTKLRLFELQQQLAAAQEAAPTPPESAAAAAPTADLPPTGLAE